MKFKFDANQPFQVQAIDSVVDLFQGQGRIDEDGFALVSDSLQPAGNRLDLDESTQLENLRRVQERNKIDPDDGLQWIEEEIETVAGATRARFANYSIEMETGTGKTYVYLRTALVLHRHYGFRKFIVVVPSVAVREGVLKTLKITEQHLRELYDNEPYRHVVYDSRSITKVRNFAQSSCVEIMVMTIDSFNREENVIRQSTDRLQGTTPIHLVQSTRPILILDEPQNMESEARIKALAALNPLFALRYSATHRNPYNLIYRLTPYDAYRQGLVKRIEVASVVKEDDFNQVFLRLDEIRSDKKTVTAHIALHKRMANGTIKEKKFTFRPGDNLESKAGRPEYATFTIDEINPGEGFVRFTNNVELRIGDSQGADHEALFREQIRYTVEQHFRRQEKLREAGIKVLSLFFIDRVENYTGTDGFIREEFDRAFDDLKASHSEWAERRADKVRGAYFAGKKTKGGNVSFIDSVSGKTSADREAYHLIMRDKERLLSFDEPTAFIFSHSALKEGWDNPNVFQICTLNQTASEIKKRQEVGRGMRLAVTQSGDRIFDDRVNVLTVVANEAYEQFVESLQQEIVEAFGREGAPPKPPDARKRQTIRLKEDIELKPEFKELWDRIRQKTRYQVSIDTSKLVLHVVSALNQIKIDPPRVVVERGRMEADENRFRALGLSMRRPVRNLAGRTALPNLVDVMADLMESTTPPVRLSKRTLLEIVRRTTNKQAALDNPQDFAVKAVQIIKVKIAQQLVDGIQYEKIQAWYEMSEWDAEIESNSDRVVDVSKSLYDSIVFDSNTERQFIERLDRTLDFIKFFVKLPRWFKVQTPVGNYNPDWGIVREEPEEFGEPGPVLYLVAETKSTLDRSKWRDSERQKTECGEKHFEEALGVTYKVVTKADEL